MFMGRNRIFQGRILAIFYISDRNPAIIAFFFPYFAQLFVFFFIHYFQTRHRITTFLLYI